MTKSRPFAAGSCKPMPGIAYGHERPFRNWKSPLLTTLIGGWLRLDPPSLELATVALEELRMRGDDLNAAMRFAEVGLPPIPWLSEAARVVRKAFPPDLLADQKKGRLNGSLYVMLRGGYSPENGTFGAYVGSTRKTPTARCLEHRKGIRAGRGLEKYGIEPLFSLFVPLNPVPGKREDLLEWETRLHEALAPVVPKVTGDVAF